MPYCLLVLKNHELLLVNSCNDTELFRIEGMERNGHLEEYTAYTSV